MSLLINITMQSACPLPELGARIFPDSDPIQAQQAATVLVGLGSFARESSNLEGPGLLPSRVHAFFRGLPGLWICVDSNCNAVQGGERRGPAGKLYGQPQRACDCGARVLELFTCRHC